jgi:prepilin-type N-terminal cleavage/methylation domain-containing protein
MRTRPRGFTLIEVATAVGIVCVVAAILLPAINKARKQAVKVQIKNNLVTIGTAIEVYKNENKGYMPVPGPTTTTGRDGYDGAVVLWEKLLKPLVSGKGTYGPAGQGGVATTQPGAVTYLNPGDFRTRTVNAAGDSVVLDRYDQPILYFPASPAKLNPRVASTAVPHPYVWNDGTSDVTSIYDARDNTGPVERTGEDNASFYSGGTQGKLSPVMRICMMLGDVHGVSPTAPSDGVIQIDETPINEPFLLWSAGADGKFGPETKADLIDCDDVTNFRD